MELNDYQHRASATAVYPSSTQIEAVSYCTLGLVGEAGELANKLKKVFRDDNGELNYKTAVALTDELGDVFWYLAMLADELGCDLEGLARLNLAKLEAREANGTLGGSGDDR